MDFIVGGIAATLEHVSEVTCVGWQSNKIEESWPLTMVDQLPGLHMSDT